MARETGTPPPEADTNVWHPARLIPVSGIRGQEEQEKRATSSLLAVMAAVPDFGKAVLTRVGAPRGRITTFAEIQLKAEDGKLSIPDGAIVEASTARLQAHPLPPRMGTKRGRGEASFVRETRRQAVDFYRDLVQGLTPWRAKAPKLPEEPAPSEDEQADAPTLRSADYVSLMEPPAGVGHDDSAG